jgi:hypothetical protein
MKVMGANMERFHVLQGIDIRDADTDDPLIVRLGLTKAIHVAEVERKLKEVGALLVFLDPAESFLEAGTKTSDGVAVRQITNPLEDMAQRTNTTTVVVVHLNKSALSDAIHRVSGAQTWFNAPRAALVAGHDPESDNGRRLLLPYKMNLAEKPTGWGYRINGAGGLVWDSPATMTAKDMLKPKINATESMGKRELAKKVLQAMLGHNDMRAEDVLSTMRVLDVGEGTLHAAQKELGICPERRGFGKEQHWWWGLPAQPPITETDDGD